MFRKKDRVLCNHRDHFEAFVFEDKKNPEDIISYVKLYCVTEQKKEIVI